MGGVFILTRGVFILGYLGGRTEYNSTATENDHQVARMQQARVNHRVVTVNQTVIKQYSSVCAPQAKKILRFGPLHACIPCK